MKVLVAEDEDDLRDIIVKKLTKDGYEVESCNNGEDAYYFAIDGEYDVAILDIMMPVMDGIEVVKKLRADGNLTPVVFLTAKDTIDDKVLGLNVGANDYVVKPFSFAELIARINAVVRTATGNISSVYEIADLQLNYNSHTVQRKNRKIELSGREYKLLEYLMANKNKVLSKEKIENYVWGYAYEGGTNVVEVYMSYLRKKIDGGEEQKLIHTIRGIGYVIKE